jgi:hypothetical protein
MIFAKINIAEIDKAEMVVALRDASQIYLPK